MDHTAAGIAALITALLGIPSLIAAAWAGVRAIRKSIRVEMEREDDLAEAQEAVEAKNAEIATKDALLATKDRTIAELTALLDQATRPEERQ